MRPIAGAALALPCVAAGIWIYWISPVDGQNAVAGSLGILALVLAIPLMRGGSSALLLPVALNAAGIVVAGVQGPFPTLGEIWWPANASAALGAILVMREPTSRIVVLSLLATVFAPRAIWISAAADRPELTINGDLIRLADLMPFLSHSVAVILTVAAIARLVPELTRAARQRQFRHAGELDFPAPNQRPGCWLSAARRHIHDVVIPALTMMSDERASPKHCRTAAQSALHGDGRSEIPEYVDLVQALQWIDDGSVAIRWRHPKQFVVPTPVADAIVSAASESLRNVKRHSGVSDATIRIRRLFRPTGGVAVTISDAGRGFMPDAVGTARFGLARSVREPMRSIGAECSVRSKPGAGCRVRLVWRPTPIRRTRSIPEIVPAHLARSLVIAASLLSGANVLSYAALGYRLGQPLLGLAGAMLLFVTTIAISTLAVTSRLGRIAALIATLATVVSISLGALAITNSDFGDPSLLMMGAPAGGVLAVIIGTRPLWEGLLSTVVVVTAMTTTAFAAGMNPVLAWPSFLAPLYGAAMGLVVVVTIDLMFGEIGLARSAVRTASERARERVEERRAQFQLLLAAGIEVYELLAKIAAGQACSPSDRVRAVRSEIALRDVLTLGAAPTVLEAARIAREHGWECTIQLPKDPPENLQASAARQILKLGPVDAGTVRSTVTVSAFPIGDGYDLVTHVRRDDRAERVHLRCPTGP